MNDFFLMMSHLNDCVTKMIMCHDFVTKIVMNTFICLIDKKQEVLEVFFLII